MIKKPGQPEHAGDSPCRRNAFFHCRQSPDATTCLQNAASKTNNRIISVSDGPKITNSSNSRVEIHLNQLLYRWQKPVAKAIQAAARTQVGRRPGRCASNLHVHGIMPASSNIDATSAWYLRAKTAPRGASTLVGGSGF